MAGRVTINVRADYRISRWWRFAFNFGRLLKSPWIVGTAADRMVKIRFNYGRGWGQWQAVSIRDCDAGRVTVTKINPVWFGVIVAIVLCVAVTLFMLSAQN
jgi:hypothetical protein